MLTYENQNLQKPIIFFDGVCGLCNFWVDFVLKYERSQVIMFAPLQGSFAKEALCSRLTKNLDSLVYRSPQGEIFTRSEAIEKILLQMGGVWHFLGQCLEVFPSALADFGYDWIAKNRYKIFGKSTTCRIPTKAQRSRFFD